jgi:large subunit ribosomal protein L35
MAATQQQWVVKRIASPLMQKTKKSVAKRFKLTATGKLIRRTPGFRHLLGAKSTKAKRRATRDKLVAPGHAAALMQCLPFGL